MLTLSCSNPACTMGYESTAGALIVFYNDFGVVSFLVNRVCPKVTV